MKNVVVVILSIIFPFFLHAQGFSSLTFLDPVPLSDKTADKAQSKVWKHDGKWWAVLASDKATKLYKLNGSAWTPVLTLTNSNTKADCRVVGDVVHMILYKGSGKTAIHVSIEYNANTQTYNFWSVRPGAVNFPLPIGATTASLVVDSDNRMWIGSNTQNSMVVWWSDAPYTNWSSPITLATGTLDDDNCVLTNLPSQNKIGIFWSNKNSKRFGFRTHTDGANPSSWSADEVPASQSAIDNIGGGMADNHMNIKVAADGTLYCVTRTSFSKSNYPQVVLLIRRPSGNWDDLYPVTMNPEGTQAILLFNEALNKLKVVYNTATNGDLFYRESSTGSISFGEAFPLITGNGSQYNSPTSTHQNYTSEVVVVATNAENTQWQSASVIASDQVQNDETPPVVNSIDRFSPSAEVIQANTVTFRATFSEPVTGVDENDFSLAVLNGNLSGNISEVNDVGSSGTTYDIVVNSLSGSGEFRVNLKNSNTGVKDLSGNNITTGFESGQTYTLQQGKPVLTAVTISSNNSNNQLAKVGDLVTLNFTASEAINTPSVKIAGHTVVPTVGNTNSYTANYTLVSGDQEGTISFSIDFVSTNGVSGDKVTSTTDNSSVTFDKTIPAVQSINRKNPSTSTISTSTVTYEVILTENVVGVDINDFALTTTGATQGNINSVSGSNSVYEVTINNISGDGTLRLDLKSNGGTITDLAGNVTSQGFNGEVYTYQQVNNPPVLNGFASITKLAPLPIKISTAHKPQHKVWSYDNRWWSILSTSTGTNIYRLDGNSWTFILKVASTTSSRADVRVVGNLVHLLLFRGASDVSYLASVEYESNSKTYKMWSQRKSLVNFSMPGGVEVASLEVDGNQRLWIAYDDVTDIYVQWSDAPYSSWSAPIKIASGLNSDDICAIAKLPGQIGVFWSNQNTKRFGFKVHNDGASPTSWSADELPASQSAIDNIGGGMADDHMNLKVTEDGTLYCAAKTSYNKTGYPQLILLIRRPNGTWDNVHPVTNYPEGTQAMLVMNEVKGKLKVVYTITETGGDILYRESLLSNIAFTSAKKLISEPGMLFNNSTSTHQSYDPSVVILATRISPTPLHAYGVLASDEPLGNNTAIASNTMVKPITDAESKSQGNLQLHPNPVRSTANFSFKLSNAGRYLVTLVDANGNTVRTLKQGFAEKNVTNTININAATLPSGVYYLLVQTDKGVASVKMLKDGSR